MLSSLTDLIKVVCKQEGKAKAELKACLSGHTEPHCKDEDSVVPGL